MATKVIYLIDNAGLLVGTAHADESPLQPGSWLLPARAIESAPPTDVPAGRWPRWIGSSWILATAPPGRTLPL